MSILLAETATSHPAGADLVVPPSVAPAIVVWAFIGWAIGGLLLAKLLRTFSRQSVMGPQRLGESDSAWDLLIVLMVGFMGGILCAGPVKAILQKAGTSDQLADLSINAAVDISTFAAIVLVLKFFRRGSLLRLGLSTRKIGVGLIGGAVAIFVLDPLVQLTGLLVEAVYNHFHLAQAKPHKVLVFLGESHVPWVTAFAVSLPVIIAPVTEELMYRGLLQTALGRLFLWMQVGPSGSLAAQSPAPRWLAIIGASVVFAAVHGEPAFFPPLFILSVGLGYVYERTGNLWVPIMCHAMFNAAQIILAAAAGGF